MINHWEGLLLCTRKFCVCVYHVCGSAFVCLLAGLCMCMPTLWFGCISAYMPRGFSQVYQVYTEKSVATSSCPGYTISLVIALSYYIGTLLAWTTAVVLIQLMKSILNSCDHHLQLWLIITSCIFCTGWSNW